MLLRGGYVPAMPLQQAGEEGGWSVGAFMAIYVRVPMDADVSVVLTPYGEAFDEPGSEFCGVVVPPLQYDGATRDESADLAALSAEFDTDVLLLGFCNITNWFLFHHWWAGRRLRALTYGGLDEKHEWDLAEGEPEPWEAKSFFDLLMGLSIQDIEAHGAAKAAAEFYHLPQWS